MKEFKIEDLDSDILNIENSDENIYFEIVYPNYYDSNCGDKKMSVKFTFENAKSIADAIYKMIKHGEEGAK